MEQLPNIAWEIFLHLNKLYDFFFYAVFTTFVPDVYIARLFARNTPSDLKCSNLYQNVCRVRDDLGLSMQPITSGGSNWDSNKAMFSSVSNSNGNSNAQRIANFPGNDSLKLEVPSRITRMSSAVLSSNDSNMHALVERSIATEGLFFLLHVLDIIRPLAEDYIPQTHRALASEVYSRNLLCTEELRSYVYACVSPRLIGAANIPKLIENTPWNVVDISEQHNEYVVTLVRKCGEFWGSLQGVGDNAVPLIVREEIWQYVVRSIMEALVEGFASVKNCSTEGRALMSMDLIALQNGLDLINHVRYACRCNFNFIL